VTVPVAVFLLVLFGLHIRPHRVTAWHAVLMPGAGAVVLAMTFTPAPVLGTGVVLAALVAVSVLLSQPDR
jgi:hypothetical protein